MKFSEIAFGALDKVSNRFYKNKLGLVKNIQCFVRGSHTFFVSGEPGEQCNLRHTLKYKNKYFVLGEPGRTIWTINLKDIIYYTKTYILYQESQAYNVESIIVD